jgi:hypothetical protein
MPYVGTYRTKSGRFHFRWSFEQQPNGDVRAYITDSPTYQERKTDCHSTHRYGLGARPYICYEPPPQNLKGSIAVAKEWAERTEKYILYGEAF